MYFLAAMSLVQKKIANIRSRDYMTRKWTSGSNSNDYKLSPDGKDHAKNSC